MSVFVQHVANEKGQYCDNYPTLYPCISMNGQYIGSSSRHRVGDIVFFFGRAPSRLATSQRTISRRPGSGASGVTAACLPTQNHQTAVGQAPLPPRAAQGHRAKKRERRCNLYEHRRETSQNRTRHNRKNFEMYRSLHYLCSRKEV